MPEFSPSESRVAIAPITVKPAGLNCLVELYLVSDSTKVVTSGLKSFTSTGAKQNVALPIIMPSAEGTYPVWLDVFAEGMLIGAYEAVEDVVIVPVPTVTFTLFIKNAPPPTTSLWEMGWVAIPAGAGEPHDIKLSDAFTITCPSTSSIRVKVYDIDAPGYVVFDGVATGVFESGYAYVFDCSTLTFKKLGEVPRLVSLVLPPSVESGSEFDIESTWFLPNPWIGVTPVYNFEVIIYALADIKDGRQYWYSRRLQLGSEIADPSHGLHTFKNYEAHPGAAPGQRPQASWEYYYVPGTSISFWVQTPMAPGLYEVQASIHASKSINGTTEPMMTYDQGIVGYLNVV